jgi:hypothetical protein
MRHVLVGLTGLATASPVVLLDQPDQTAELPLGVYVGGSGGRRCERR